MKSGRRLSLGLLFVALAVLLLPAAAYPEPAPENSRFTGMYLSHEGKHGPYMSLSLGADGTATLTEDPGAGTVVRFGHWKDAGDQVTVRFDPEQGKPTPSPMTFRQVNGGLQASTWNHAFWGKVVPPPMEKGTSVKQTYWFSTVR